MSYGNKTLNELLTDASDFFNRAENAPNPEGDRGAKLVKNLIDAGWQLVATCRVLQDFVERHEKQLAKQEATIRSLEAQVQELRRDPLTYD